MGHMPAPSKLTLLVTGILLGVIFTLLYTNQAEGMTNKERWAALPRDDRRQAIEATCLLNYLDIHDTQIEDLEIQAFCERTALKAVPEEIIE